MVSVKRTLLGEWRVCGVAMGRAACLLAPTSLGPTYTMDLMGCRGQWGYQGKKKHFWSHAQTLESQPLRVVTAVTMETPESAAESH